MDPNTYTDDLTLPRLRPLPSSTPSITTSSAESDDNSPPTPHHDIPISGADHRHPLYLGDWKRHYANIHTSFASDDLDEPHLKRKISILQKHPEITKLYGYDPNTKWITLLTVSIQMTLAYLFGHVFTESLSLYLITAYIVGGTCTGLFGVILHECTHNLCAESPLANRLLSLICNIGIPVPIAQGFRRYHLEHHTYQGVDGYDPDLPLEWELNLVRGNVFQKVLWILIFPVMYVVRGAAMGKTASKWELINYAWTISTNALVVYTCGWRGFGYLVLSLWMGYSLHPAAAHFIQEHYTFEDGQETYSYYGSGNILMMNIGFHNEHHDFAAVPWSKLPDVRRVAAEFYEPLRYHASWFWLLYKFLTSSVMGPQSRVSRSVDAHRSGRKMLKRARATEHESDKKCE